LIHSSRHLSGVTRGLVPRVPISNADNRDRRDTSAFTRVFDALCPAMTPSVWLMTGTRKIGWLGGDRLNAAPARGAGAQL